MIQQLKFFGKDINSLYETELEKIKGIAESHNINNVDEDWQLDNEITKVMAQFWNWPAFTLNRGGIEADNGSDDYNYELGDKYLNRITHVSPMHKRKLYYAKYKMPFSFDAHKTMDYGEKGYSIPVWGTLSNTTQPTVYIFSENELIDHEIANIKSKKEDLLIGIEAGLLKNEIFRKEKSAEAKIEVEKILKQRFADLRKKRDINSKL